MAKKTSSQDAPRRTTRKEYLLSRKQQEQYQQIRLIVLGIVGLIALVLIAGLVYEYAIKPGQPVASINGEEISLGEWQTRTRLERVQSIADLENFSELLGGDVAQLQQFAQNQIISLLNPVVLGDQVLNQMIDERLIRQEAASRNISVSEAEIDEAVAAQFSYYDGGLPTATPQPTETPVPTPSVTPIGFEEDPDAVVAATPEPVPDVEPTAVSAESFDEQRSEALALYEEAGAGETEYRYNVATQLYAEKLRDALAEDADLMTEEENVSFFLLEYRDEDAANEAMAQLDAGEEYLTLWNTVRSADGEDATQPVSFANEYQWTPTERISQTLGALVHGTVTSLDGGETSGVVATESGNFFIIQMRGREMRPVSEANLDGQQTELLRDLLEENRGVAEIFPRWETNVPDRPILDPKYYRSDPVPPVDDAAPIGEDG